MDVDRYDRLSRDRFDDVSPNWDHVRSQNHQWDDAPVSRSPGMKIFILSSLGIGWTKVHPDFQNSSKKIISYRFRVIKV